MDEITLHPIGIIHTPYAEKYDAPRQPEVDDRVDRATVELFPHQNYEQALDDLVGFDRIWIISWFHRALNWKPKVLPPRSQVKRGVFATRSPHRPNPIGLTCVRLIDVDGLRIHVAGTDLLDGTPVLDIKPYLPYADAFPDVAAGCTTQARQAQYTVVVPAALEATAPDVAAHARRVLSMDPFPHPYRRTKRLADDTYELALKQWRCIYVIDDHVVSVTAIVLQS